MVRLLALSTRWSGIGGVLSTSGAGPVASEAYHRKSQAALGILMLSPMLWGDQVVGWANLSIREERLQAELGFVSSHPSEAPFQQALEEELALMSSFPGLEGWPAFHRPYQSMNHRAA